MSIFMTGNPWHRRQGRDFHPLVCPIWGKNIPLFRSKGSEKIGVFLIIASSGPHCKEAMLCRLGGQKRTAAAAVPCVLYLYIFLSPFGPSLIRKGLQRFFPQRMCGGSDAQKGQSGTQIKEPLHMVCLQKAPQTRVDPDPLHTRRRNSVNGGKHGTENSQGHQPQKADPRS